MIVRLVLSKGNLTRILLFYIFILAYSNIFSHRGKLSIVGLGLYLDSKT